MHIVQSFQVNYMCCGIIISMVINNGLRWEVVPRFNYITDEKENEKREFSGHQSQS